MAGENKSAIEMALDSFPSMEELKKDFEPGNDVPDIYRKLRQLEEAYEELQAQGHDVSEQLRERRCQIAEFVLGIMLGDVENLHIAVKQRDVYAGTLTDFMDGLVSRAYVPRIREYMKKLVPEWVPEIDTSKCSELFPDD